MPGLNGVELYNTMKEINPNVKVIFICGYINKEEEKKLLDDGVSRVLIKPVMTEVLINAIYDTLATADILNIPL